MVKKLSLFCTLCALMPALLMAQPDPNANWRALVAEAYAKSDLVVRGTVESVRDETAVDGGHVYSLRVTGQQKGSAEQSVSLRAGGFFYTVPMAVGESVLLFLKSSGREAQVRGGPAYSVVEVATLTPMAFRMQGAEARPVDSRLQADFAGVSADEIEGLLRSIKP